MHTEDIEVRLLIDAIKLKYDYDFSQYSQASLFRRIKKAKSDLGVNKVSEMIPVLLYDKVKFHHFISSLSVNVTDFFRDPDFFKIMRKSVVPYLKTYPYLKIWLAGIASGKEAYSIAILLKEEGLYDNSTIYATDFDDAILDVAKAGIYDASNLNKDRKNYIDAGGKSDFEDYYSEGYDLIKMKASLKKNIVFANHNLAVDSSFGQMNLIFCRNVLIYFNKNLKNKVLGLMDDSLLPNGFLGLGTKETLDFSNISSHYAVIDNKMKMYQKVLVTRKVVNEN